MTLTLKYDETFTILKTNSGVKINDITLASQQFDGFLLPPGTLAGRRKMVSTTE